MMKKFTPADVLQTKFLFFTGKGGVGKTTTACAAGVALADMGRKVLIVSTDPASNLDDMFHMEFTSVPVEVPGVPGLYGADLDPEEAAAAYREQVVGPIRGKLPSGAVKQIEEQLSGACTVEIAAFNEFSRLLSDETVSAYYDHVIFDTAPTGHTLRLLQLPKAWSGFIQENQHGTSCLGPLSGLGDKKDLYQKTVDVLTDGSLTTLMLVSRPDESSLAEAARAGAELKDIGLANQKVIVNGVFETVSEDPIAVSFWKKQVSALKSMPASLTQADMYSIPYNPGSLRSSTELRSFFLPQQHLEQPAADHSFVIHDNTTLNSLVKKLSEKKRGIVMTMGKGGVGKTTIAAAVAVGLAEQGLHVHVSTTDPAAHLDMTLGTVDGRSNISVGKIDPIIETEKYRQQMLRTVGKDLDADGLELLKEDLASPCTEEIAVFQAFAQEVEKADDGFIILDTAPTGHTLLLLDAAQSYHREIEKAVGDVPPAVKNLLPKLRDPEMTHIILVTLPEATPVLEARRLRNDLVRAGIEASSWVINQSFLSLQTEDPLLLSRAHAEVPWIQAVQKESPDAWYVVNWTPVPPVGWDNLISMSQAYEGEDVYA